MFRWNTFNICNAPFPLSNLGLFLGWMKNGKTSHRSYLAIFFFLPDDNNSEFVIVSSNARFLSQSTPFYSTKLQKMTSKQTCFWDPLQKSCFSVTVLSLPGWFVHFRPGFVLKCKINDQRLKNNGQSQRFWAVRGNWTPPHVSIYGCEQEQQPVFWGHIGAFISNHLILH